MKVFLVKYDVGEYSGRSEGVLSVHASEEGAKAEIARHVERYEESQRAGLAIAECTRRLQGSAPWSRALMDRLRADEEWVRLDRIAREFQSGTFSSHELSIEEFEVQA